MKCGVLLIALLGTAGVYGSPVEQVVTLLTTMKNQITADGKVEQQIYDKYACWCEKTAKRKAEHIVEAGNDLRSLGQSILKLKGKVATLTAEIAELTKKITSNEKEQKTLTAIRQKENAAWAAESEETKQAITALQQAITVLAAATTPGGKKSALLQQSARAQSQGAVKAVLENLPSQIAVKDATMTLLSEFTTAKAGYFPQSATVQGMLADMYTTFAKNLQTSTAEEASANAKFEQLYAAMEKENNIMKVTREKKSSEKADAEALLADTTKNYEDTEKQMKADTAFFDETKDACESKHEEWTLRSKQRSEELEGISKAIEILSSDESRELFAKSIKPGVETFLQIGSTPALLQDAASLPAAKAYAALKAQVKQTKSFRLAALAVKVRTAKVGHFDEVIKAIDEMIQTLKDEGAADIAKRDQCKDEYQKIASTVADVKWKIKNNEAKIEKLEKRIALREKELAETHTRIGEVKQAITDMTEERKTENAAFLQAKKYDEDAIGLLEKAKGALASYYKNNSIEIGEIQGSVKLLQDEPVFERSADDAPDATFSKKGSRKGQSKNILSLLSYIIEDLSDEISNAVKNEEKAQLDFEEELAAANKLKKDLEDRVVTLNDLIAKRKGDKEEETSTMNNNIADKNDELDYQTKIKPDCDWIIGAFEKRAAARAAEMNGLSAAKDYLAGQSALTQKSQKGFDDNALPRIGFLGISH